MKPTQKKLLISMSASLLLSSGALPASAYYLGYTPYGGGAGMLLWPLESLLYRFGSPFYGFGRGMGYPLWGNGSVGFRNPLGYAAYMKDLEYQNQNYNPNQRGNQPPPNLPNTQPAQFVPNYGAGPPVAGSPARPGQSAPSAPTGASFNGSGNRMPVSRGFIDRVNQRFHGDIKAALSDADMRAWAEAIGLLAANDHPIRHLNKSRVGLIRQILQDQSLSPGGKIETVAVLLKQ